MNSNINFKSFNRFQFYIKEIQVILIVILCSFFISSCGGDDAKLQISKFWAKLKWGSRL